MGNYLPKRNQDKGHKKPRIISLSLKNSQRLTLNMNKKLKEEFKNEVYENFGQAYMLRRLRVTE